jgi:hypothetical protein
MERYLYDICRLNYSELARKEVLISFYIVESVLKETEHHIATYCYVVPPRTNLSTHTGPAWWVMARSSYV